MALSYQSVAASARVLHDPRVEHAERLRGCGAVAMRIGEVELATFPPDLRAHRSTHCSVIPTMGTLPACLPRPDLSCEPIDPDLPPSFAPHERSRSHPRPRVDDPRNPCGGGSCLHNARSLGSAKLVSRVGASRPGSRSKTAARGQQRAAGSSDPQRRSPSCRRSAEAHRARAQAEEAIAFFLSTAELVASRASRAWPSSFAIYSRLHSRGFAISAS
jgi:hypothetical protein